MLNMYEWVFNVEPKKENPDRSNVERKNQLESNKLNMSFSNLDRTGCLRGTNNVEEKANHSSHV